MPGSQAQPGTRRDRNSLIGARGKLEASLRIHVVTVGASILTNSKSRGLQCPDPGAPATEMAQALANPALGKAIASEVVRDPAGMSAELNAMAPFLDSNEVDSVYLVSTASPAGRFAAEILKEVFSNHYRLRVERARELIFSPGEAEELLAESLQHMWQSIIEFGRHKLQEGHELFINANGGLKPETAICMIAGNVLGIPVYYRHELFKTTITLPTLVRALCPGRIKSALGELGDEPLSGPQAARYFEKCDGQLLENLHLIVAERDPHDGKVVRVKLAPYGKLLRDQSI